MSVFLGVLTIAAFYLLGKIFFNEKAGLTLATILAFSFVNVIWDQNPWSPSLFYFAQLFILVGTYLAIRKPYGIVLTAIGFIIGFQAHVGIFLSLASSLVFWLLFRPRLKSKFLFISLTIIIFGFLPNLVFDITHNFVNFKRGLGIFSGNSVGEVATLNKVFTSLAFSNISIFYPFFSKFFAKVAFTVLVSWGVWKAVKDKKDRSLLILLLLSIVLPVIFFACYRTKFSEYYLMMTILPFLTLVGYFINCYLARFRYLLGLIIFLFVSVNVKEFWIYKRSKSLGAKRAAVVHILEKAGKEGYGVSLSTAPGENFGFAYLFHYYDMKPNLPPLKNQQKIMTIVVPEGFDGIFGQVDFGGVGVIKQGI